jgi:Fe-S-cluster-containing dehydrogenase component
MQLGFVIDHSRCIGCHACTVACKSENDVPLGNFRTWVKYTEQGEFPLVKRNFSVLRCNQCTDAPCVTICPVTALAKGEDGIVEVDPDRCIGCKSCMHACPYDALYINEQTGTAEKCHFCAHRTAIGLAPACAVVCPTEAIIPGDFDDPGSRVSRLRATGELAVRKPEAGTRPNVYYREAAAVGLDPGATNLSQGFIWSNPPTGPRAEAQAWEAGQQGSQPGATARTTYDVPRKQLWGWKITGYLFAKSLSAGIVPVAFLAAAFSGTLASSSAALGGSLALWSLVFLSITGLLLVLDLKRPERFWMILLRPNWSSWLARGTFIIVAYSGVLALWWLIGAGSASTAASLGTAATLLGAGTAGYTGYLFAQAKGRVLWMRRGFALHLVVQAGLAGAAFLLCWGALASPLPEAAAGALQWIFTVCLVIHGAFTLAEEKLAPPGREVEYHRAARLLTRGPYAYLHWSVGVGLGLVLPLALILFGPPMLLAAAGALALIAMAVEEDLLVRAGQALPIS